MIFIIVELCVIKNKLLEDNQKGAWFTFNILEMISLKCWALSSPVPAGYQWQPDLHFRFDRTVDSDPTSSSESRCKTSSTSSGNKSIQTDIDTLHSWNQMKRDSFYPQKCKSYQVVNTFIYSHLNCYNALYKSDQCRLLCHPKFVENTSLLHRIKDKNSLQICLLPLWIITDFKLLKP